MIPEAPLQLDLMLDELLMAGARIFQLLIEWVDVQSMVSSSTMGAQGLSGLVPEVARAKASREGSVTRPATVSPDGDTNHGAPPVREMETSAKCFQAGRRSSDDVTESAHHLCSDRRAVRAIASGRLAAEAS